MKIDSKTISEEVLLQIKKTGMKSISRRRVVRTLGKVLKYIVDDIIEELKREGIKITK